MATKVEIVRRGEGLLELVGQLEVRLAKARGQMDKLTPSLLASQLVPQDPTDEPAEELLGRVEGGRTDSAKTMRTRAG